MKMIYLILFLLLMPLLLTSCIDKGDYVDKDLSKIIFYSRDKTKIWYKNVNAPDITGLWDYDWVEVPADAKTYQLMKYGIGKDKNNFFWGVHILENVDYHTFNVDDDGLFKDKNHVYLTEYGGKLKILESANPATYKKISFGEQYGRHNDY